MARKIGGSYGINKDDIIFAAIYGAIGLLIGAKVVFFITKVPKVITHFEEFKNLPYLENIFEQKNNKWHIDTIQINREILKVQGLKEENIIDSGICSVCNKSIIHSYRAHGEGAGRATQIIAFS